MKFAPVTYPATQQGQSDLMDGPLITAWTIRLALVVLLVSVVLGMIRPWWPANAALRRAIWTLGCVVFLAHIAAGMHFYHDWDHTRAYEDTAQQTYDTLGVKFGGGIYVNHLMAMAWTSDVIWWWLAPKSHDRRSPHWDQAIVAFFLFIAFNGLVVFKQGSLRIAGIIAFGGLAIIWLAVRIIMGKPKQPEFNQP